MDTPEALNTAQPIRFSMPEAGEETARADLYGVLAALFAAPPHAGLLASIAAAGDDGDGVLGQAWHALAADARAAQDAAGRERIREEYERLFIGIGKPEVMLYGSFYLSGFLMEKPLAALRTDLAALGIERADGVVESEDHVASLCEVMRYLIASQAEERGQDDGYDGVPLSEHDSLARQKIFFGSHLQPWVGQMCAAIAAHPASRFYASVAVLAQCFFEVEAQAFDIG